MGFGPLLPTLSRAGAAAVKVCWKNKVRRSTGANP